MRIGCLQFAPQVADVDNNLNRADAVLNKADPEDLDLLVLPELAFSGYNFKSLEHISPFLEVCGSGISALWARTTALKYNCHVAVGYPEKVDPTTSWPTDPEYYNSLIVVNEDGETVANYRKSHLYYTDETWALEGDEGFFEGYIEGLGDTSMGICMDLNPYKFEAPWSSFEFAFHVLECQSNLAIVSMAWMTREDSRTFSRLPNEPDMDTLTYWATRLEPLIRVEGEREVIIIFCNRTGMEDNVVYAGTSAVVGILDGEVRVYGVLGRGEKELLVIDTDNPPYAKLVQRQGDGDSVAQGELQTSDISITPYSARATQSKRKSRESKQGGTTDASQSSPANTSSVGMSFEDTTTLQNRRSRAQPQLQVSTDSVRQTANANSATSARSMDSNIPTPSAPSPTPNGTRPKLVIPQTPHSAVRQGLSPMPMSAQSIHSVKSNISTRSRPPEDSTPYPHSGVPPSGHPRSRTMYDGNTSIAQRAFSPTTPFDNGSPVAYRTGSDVASQVSRGTVSTARHRPPRRAFQEWPVIKPRAAENRDVMPASQKMAAWLAKEAGGTYSEPFSEDFRLQEDSRALGHPSSSKSRDTSRTGHHERSNSSLAQQDNAEFEQLVGSIQRRTDSGSRTRGQAGQGSLPSRPESRKGLDRGLSRSARKATPIVVGVTDKAVARDVARPSTGGLPGESHKARRSTSRTGTHARSASISEDAHMRATNTLINYTAEPEQPGSRAVSRGRRPGPHSSSVSHIEIGIGFDALRDFKEKRAPASRHADSPSTTSRSGNPPHETSRHRSGTGTSSRQASRAAQHDDEVTFCPNCSHEFRAPSKTPSRHAQSSLSNYQSSPRQGVPMSQNALDLIHQMNSRSASMDSRSSVSDSFATSEIDSFGTRGTASALEISPSTPEYGDMKTPKALIFFHDTDEVAEERKPIAPNTDEKTLSSSSCLKQVVL